MSSQVVLCVIKTVPLIMNVLKILFKVEQSCNSKRNIRFFNFFLYETIGGFHLSHTLLLA